MKPRFASSLSAGNSPRRERCTLPNKPLQQPAELVRILKQGFEVRSSFPCKRESMFTRPKWIPAFAGMTSFSMDTN